MVAACDAVGPDTPHGASRLALTAADAVAGAVDGRAAVAAAQSKAIAVKLPELAERGDGPNRYVWVEADAATRRAFMNGRWDIMGAGRNGLRLSVRDAELRALREAGLRVEMIDPDPRATALALQTKAGYPDWDDVLDALFDAEATYPNLVHVESLGRTHDGNDIWAARITDNPTEDEADEPPVRITGAHHGDELTSVAVMLGLIEELTTSYQTDDGVRALVNGLDIWIVPAVNPDGFVRGTRENALGVDVNRDYGYEWSGWGTSDAPFSQPEPRAMAAQNIVRPFVLQFDFHTVATIVNHLWDFSPYPTADDDIVVPLSNQYAATTGYEVLRGWDWYETHGSAQDAEYGLFGTIGWTIETPQPWRNPDADVADNVAALLDVLWWAQRGIHGVVEGARGGGPLDARVEVIDRGVHTWTTASTGAFHRILPDGDYRLLVSAPGHCERVVLGTETRDVMNGGRLAGVELNRCDDVYAHRLLTTWDTDSGNDYQNRSLRTALLGAPDGESFSLGSGGAAVVDLGVAVEDGEGDDLHVWAPTAGDVYYLEVSASPFGPWTGLGAADTSASFDLAGSGLSEVRYLRVVDDHNGSSADPEAGAEIDALGALTGYAALDLTGYSIVEAAGDGDGVAEPLEDALVRLRFTNRGPASADDVSITVRSGHEDVEALGGAADLEHSVPSSSRWIEGPLLALGDLDPSASFDAIAVIREGGSLRREIPLRFTLGGGVSTPPEPGPEPVAEPVTVEPVVEPVVAEPVVAEPMVAEPVVAEPVVAEPMVVEPVVAEPVVAEPVVAEPVVAEPVVAEPVVAEPVVAEPVVAEPVVAEPVVAEPVVAEPVVAEPVVAEPMVTEPMADAGSAVGADVIDAGRSDWGSGAAETGAPETAASETRPSNGVTVLDAGGGDGGSCAVDQRGGGRPAAGHLPLLLLLALLTFAALRRRAV